MLRRACARLTRFVCLCLFSSSSSCSLRDADDYYSIFRTTAAASLGKEGHHPLSVAAAVGKHSLPLLHFCSSFLVFVFICACLLFVCACHAFIVSSSSSPQELGCRRLPLCPCALSTMVYPVPCEKPPICRSAVFSAVYISFGVAFGLACSCSFLVPCLFFFLVLCRTLEARLRVQC